MYKVVWLARFREGISGEEARRHWRDSHGPLGAAVPGMKAYVQSHVVAGLGDGEPAFDGYSCSWFASRESFVDALATAEWAALGPDGDKFFDMAWFTGMSASLDERTIVEGDYAPFKTVWVVRFKDEIRRDPARTHDAHEHWIEVHGHQLGRAVPGMPRYVQNHCVAPLGDRDEDESVDLLFDGFSECWWPSREDYERVTSSPEWLEMSADAESFCDVDYIGRMSAVLEENVVMEGRKPAHV
jgi:uncharacterized protein (TIGR02118 family)